MASLILASSSPRRRQLLAALAVDFEVDVQPVDETVFSGEEPRTAAARIATAKAAVAAPRHPGTPVLGADTMVVCEDRILGKPATLDEARAMLTHLSGRTHEVLTGVCLMTVSPSSRQTWVACTEVRFHPLPDATIEQYLDSVHVLDKAGAYAIQQSGELLIERINGSYSNVVGLPVEDVITRLNQIQVQQA
ncbi:MAG: Maf family protein [Verrucomicrobiota bacterium]